MPQLLDLVHLSVGSLLCSVTLLVFAGHRVRIGHPALSVACLAFVVCFAYGAVTTATGRPPDAAAIVVALLAGFTVIACSPNWNAIGQTCFASVIVWVFSYLAYVTQVTTASSPGSLALAFALLLMMLVSASLLLMVAHAFEVIDVLCRIRWNRRFTPGPVPGYTPKVSLHVPAYNEPPELVIRTLNALAALDYPNFEVIVIDDNTRDPAVWRPVQEHCRRLGFRFFHLENWPGYKSGALNHALAHVTPDTEVIGVVDADYIVESSYLRDLVGFFVNPNVAFVQTPQDYRDVDARGYQSALYRSYQYFFKLSMASRNERNGIIFTGTMGLIRRSALERVGGWDEWCITEDAEVALKMLNLGHESVFVDRSYGRGLMPLDFEGLRRQRFRWAFGGMQVLRLHWKKLLPGSRLWNRSGRLTFAQKFDYWSGALQWLNDPLTFLFTSILLLCAVSYTLGQALLLQPIAASAVFMPFLFITFGILKMLWALRLRLQCSLADAHRAFLILLSLTWVVTMACALGLTRRQGRFLRTPKRPGVGSGHGLSIIRTECALVAFVLGTVVWVSISAPGGAVTVVLCGLLLWQVYIYGSAWIVNRWSRNRVLSEERREFDAAVRGVLPVRAPLVSDDKPKPSRTTRDIQHQPGAITVRLLAAHADEFSSEGEMRRHSPTDSRAAP
ncbi:MAG: glycosyltransferase [Gammaproteobacteria bacterium]|jgi:cellulose synthase/poly-beta-1,6-N-acetylglucosamine synthase-like glycosyltransferase|nr:glycosyltransferase [Gammaproteobacteria bacterium]